jgi:hypothetical protein
MSDPELPESQPKDEEVAAGKAPPGGINLWVVYGLMFLALLAAIGLATLIVLLFFQRR